MINAEPVRLGVAIIGTGRVGAVLGAALREAGHIVIGASGISEASRERREMLLPGVPHLEVQEAIERAELVLLTVPDDALPELVTGLASLNVWHPGHVVVHTAGRHGVGVLAAAQAGGAVPLALHPAMTFTGTSMDLARLRGAPFAVTAPAAAEAIGQALVIEMGGEPFVVAEGDRALYHAALTHGANHLVTLVSQALRILESAQVGHQGQTLAPLLNAALDNALRNGDLGLTGPVLRGDVGTVQAHLDALAELSLDPGAADIEATYRALARATVQRTVATGRLPEQAAAALLDVLDPKSDT